MFQDLTLKIIPSLMILSQSIRRLISAIVVFSYPVLINKNFAFSKIFVLDRVAFAFLEVELYSLF